MAYPEVDRDLYLELLRKNGKQLAEETRRQFLTQEELASYPNFNDRIETDEGRELALVLDQRIQQRKDSWLEQIWSGNEQHTLVPPLTPVQYNTVWMIIKNRADNKIFGNMVAADA